MSVVTATITSGGDPMDPTYELYSLDIIKEVNRIPYAQVILLDGDAAKQTFEISDTDFFLPGKAIEIKLRYEDKPSEEATVFKGLVVRHGVEASGQGSLLTVACKDAAIALTAGRKSNVFREQTDDKVIGQIVGDAGLTKGAMAATQPPHAELVQYACTDWDFILSRADVHGLLIVVEGGGSRSRRSSSAASLRIRSSTVSARSTTSRWKLMPATSSRVCRASPGTSRPRSSPRR